MITEFSVEDKHHMDRAREVFIRITLLAIMGVSCLLLLRPFLNMIITGIIIAIGISPAYRRLTKLLSTHDTWAAVLCTAVLLVVIILPAVVLAGTLADGIHTLAGQLQAGRLNLPPPPPILGKLPIIGVKLKELWTLCSTNLSEAAKRFAPQIYEHIPALLSASVAIGGALLQFLIAIVFAGFLLATGKRSTRVADRVFARIFDDQGPEFETLIASTIRSVTNGILGVAAIQSLLASLGFLVVGLPGAGLWAVLFLIASVLQVGPLVLVPAVLYVFAVYSTSSAVIFLLWCIVVGLMDNILKPILLGRGSKVPMAVVFLGVLGGFLAMGIIGLFVGAITLSVGYKLFMAWLDARMRPAAGTHVSGAEAGTRPSRTFC